MIKFRVEMVNEDTGEVYHVGDKVSVKHKIIPKKNLKEVENEGVIGQINDTYFFLERESRYGYRKISCIYYESLISIEKVIK